MTRRAVGLAVVALGVALASAPAGAQEGYVGGWTDPAPRETRDDVPLVYLDEPVVLTGQVAHENGIATVSALVVPADEPPQEACEATVDDVVVEPSGTSAVFRVTASLPCNLVYELRATAQANASGGVTATRPAPYAMPLLVAMAVPPAPVPELTAELEVDGDDRTVTLEWPEGQEPDLLGYVITRSVGDDVSPLGQVEAGDRTRFVDEDPPTGTTASYQVTPVRNGPDDEVTQVAGPPTTVEVPVPPTEEQEQAAAGPDGGGPSEPVDPELASEQRPSEAQGRPDPGLLSGVNSRGVAPGPPTTIDTGYSETIEYPEPGEEGAVPPSVPGSRNVVVEFDEGGPIDAKQRMAYIAAGLAVLVGAAHVMTVTRRAAHEAY